MLIGRQRLTDNEIINDVSTTLVRGGSVSGAVHLRNGLPITNVNVTAYWFDGSDSSRVIYATTTDAKGHYWLKAMLPGRYRVSFYKQGAGYDIEEFYSPTDRVFQVKGGADVLVVADKTTTGIDLILGPNPTLYLPLIAQRK